MSTKPEKPALTAIQRKRVEAWVAALRSGKYKQTRGTLRSATQDSYCCLGVGCEVFRRRKRAGEWVPAPHYSHKSDSYVFLTNGGSSSTTLPTSVSEYFGLMSLRFGAEGALIRLNDNAKYSFSRIANWLERRILCKK